MIYLDHCATTKPYPEVCRTVAEAMEKDFWNPSAMYKPAKETARLMEEAFALLASDLGCLPEELIQTSCATEASNTVFKGLYARYGSRLNTLIASEADHDATLSTLKYLEQKGARVILLKPLKNGLLDPEDLRQVLDERSLCVSILHVNNETGIVQDTQALIDVIKEKAPQCYIHLDMVQAWGRMPIRLHKMQADFASFSAHKIHGPKGVGLLYKRAKVTPDILIHGGGQQRGWRSGTENWPALAGMAKAAEIQSETYESRKEKTEALSAQMKEGLRELGGIISFPEAVPEIISVSFPGLRGETLLHMLEEKEVYVSTSSACQAGSGAVSHVLKACRMDRRQAEGTLRISLDADNSPAEITEFLRILGEQLEQLKAWKMY